MRYVTLNGALWQLNHDRYVDLLKEVAENKPYNLCVITGLGLGL